jgi:hypothetical protein
MRYYGEFDIYRIPLQTGEPENVSKCGNLTTAWFAGGDVFLYVGEYGIDPTKQGLYRISVDKLAQATRAFPTPRFTPLSELLNRISTQVSTAVGPGAIEIVTLDNNVVAKAAQAFAGSAGTAGNERFDFSEASLPALRALLNRLPYKYEAVDRAFILGAGSYYGEVLRKAGRAEWRFMPVPFGQWLPGPEPEANPLARALLPFSAVHQFACGSEYSRLETEATLERNAGDGQRLILAYPPNAASQLLADASDPDYSTALKLLDAGEVVKAGELWTGLMKKYPRNRGLAEDAIAACEAAGLPDLVKYLVHRAVENGSEVPQLLLRYADELAQTDPAKARDAYRRVTAGYFGTGDAFAKLGKLYAAQNEIEIARSCWRAGYLRADAKVKSALKKLLFPDAPDIPDEIPVDDFDN